MIRFKMLLTWLKKQVNKSAKKLFRGIKREF